MKLKKQKTKTNLPKQHNRTDLELLRDIILVAIIIWKRNYH